MVAGRKCIIIFDAISNNECVLSPQKTQILIKVSRPFKSVYRGGAGQVHG